MHTLSRRLLDSIKLSTGQADDQREQAQSEFVDLKSTSGTGTAIMIAGRRKCSIMLILK